MFAVGVFFRIIVWKQIFAKKKCVAIGFFQVGDMMFFYRERERVCNCQRIDFFPNLSTQLVHRQWPGLCFGPSPFKIELLGASGFPT